MSSRWWCRLGVWGEQPGPDSTSSPRPGDGRNPTHGTNLPPGCQPLLLGKVPCSGPRARLCRWELRSGVTRVSPSEGDAWHRPTSDMGQCAWTGQRGRRLHMHAIVVLSRVTGRAGSGGLTGTAGARDPPDAGTATCGGESPSVLSVPTSAPVYTTSCLEGKRTRK